LRSEDPPPKAQKSASAARCNELQT
jgi:hypothetical protein